MIDFDVVEGGEQARVHDVDIADTTVSPLVTLEAVAARSVAAEHKFYLLGESVIDSVSFGQ